VVQVNARLLSPSLDTFLGNTRFAYSWYSLVRTLLLTKAAGQCHSSHILHRTERRAPIAVTAFVQSEDEYLRIGGPDGLYWFNGANFERFQPQSGSRFPARTVSSLLAVTNGDIWIGSWSGVISLLKSRSVTNYTSRDGVPEERISVLAHDLDGMIWAATSLGMARLEGDRWKVASKDWAFSILRGHFGILLRTR
jgi:ligand-binding sensor domain-containing protein